MSVWVFGYGSLIWRPGFSYEERLAAIASGFTRRLDQGSPDHRGTPERLGRVATLARAPGERCGGVAYRLPDADATATLAALDVREQGGYERVALPVALVGTPQREVIAVTWIASHDNPFHLGATPFPEMAREIRAASGPSGSNLEYVLALHDALAALGFSDPHVEAVVAALGASTRE